MNDEKTSIYEEEEQTGLAEGKKLTDPDVLILLFISFVWVVFRGGQEVIKLGNYDLYFASAIIAWLLLQAGWITLKHLTPKLVCDPIHTTTIGYGDEFGIYTCFTIGDVRAGTFELRGKKGTIIVPTSAVRYLGRNISLDTPVRPIDEMEIPYTIRREVLQRGYPPPFYRGYVSDITLRKLPMVNKLIAEVNYTNKQANMLADFIDKYMSTYEKWDEYARRKMMMKMEKEGMLKRLWDWSKGGEQS